MARARTASRAARRARQPGARATSSSNRPPMPSSAAATGRAAGNRSRQARREPARPAAAAKGCSGIVPPGSSPGNARQPRKSCVEPPRKRFSRPLRASRRRRPRRAGRRARRRGRGASSLGIVGRSAVRADRRRQAGRVEPARFRPWPGRCRRPLSRGVRARLRRRGAACSRGRTDCRPSSLRRLPRLVACSRSSPIVASSPIVRRSSRHPGGRDCRLVTRSLAAIVEIVLVARRRPGRDRRAAAALSSLLHPAVGDRRGNSGRRTAGSIRSAPGRR